MEHIDEFYMKRALKLAEKGRGYTSPNPMVGCVIVKDGVIIGEGYHERYGELHAERNALQQCTQNPEGATLYVTLEPCCHYGKTPPCTEAIIEHGIKRVVIGCIDPNPAVGGKGIAILQEYNIEITQGVLEKECYKLNEVFFHYIKTQTPFVVMKYAMTLDGKIATASGDSKWVTGEKAREHVHQLRHNYSAIMVGIGTVLADDPMLNCRLEHGNHPIRIVCDSNLQIPIESKIVQTAKEIKTIVACCNYNQEKVLQLEEQGIQIIYMKAGNKVSLQELLVELGKREIDSILVEGGGTLHGSFLEECLIQKVYAYISPKLIGGIHALSPVEGKGMDKMNLALLLKNTTVQLLEEDIVVIGEVE